MKLKFLQETHILNLLFKIVLLFLNFHLVSNTENIAIIYIETNGIITEMKLLNESNYELTLYNISVDEVNNTLKKEIDLNYIDSIFINISNKENESFISFGVLFQINTHYYDLNNLEFSYNKEILCNTTKILHIDNNTNEKEIINCFQNNTENIELSITMPSDNYDTDCYETCLKCNEKGNETNHKCTRCDYFQEYYFKENDEYDNCYNKNTIGNGYYLSEKLFIFKTYKKCNNRCLTCNSRGTDSSSNCIKCNNILGYHFDPSKQKHCINFYELANTNYYLDENEDKYKLCHATCLKCDGPNNNNCQNCYNSKGYYFIVNDDSRICYSKNINGYYLNATDNLLYKCNNRCLSCDNEGTDINSNCIKCNNEDD